MSAKKKQTQKCAPEAGGRKTGTKRSSERRVPLSLFLFFSSFLLFRDANTILSKTRAHDAPTGPGKRLTRMANYSLGAPPLRHFAPRPGAWLDEEEGVPDLQLLHRQYENVETFLEAPEFACFNYDE
ncbi:PREDICTED: uncharacterized protein LOC108775126 [Cyphomyrmex costatus]|uniref:Uncharacterized protein n=1 Tax=Cyphomyrmex costatus TaxID=456900 RepID=A0A151IHI0_9HYME|nr:PREDICTED: uncharacterized protein LOC108775126 [Cyphomyrmex costatus]KYN01424.1 hypothetical protein ALC62_07774 [Cyphomyrmex costatus]